VDEMNAEMQTKEAPNAPTVAHAPGGDTEATEQLTADIVKALKSVYDPEIPADIYELGLIYRVEI